MINLLFVDDEPLLLGALQRTLRPMRSEWRARFAESAAEALQILGSEAFDVVVSDMRMPGKNGVELLREVAQRYPATIRIALSGQTDVDMACESALVTHQYLAKPCDLDALRSTIEKAARVKALLDDSELQALVGSLATLPSLPRMYERLVEELESRDCSINEVGRIIAGDIAMTAKLLKLVNSAYFSLPRTISSPAEAVSFLGLDVVKTLVLSLHVFAKFESAPESRLHVTQLWEHSTAVAAISQALGELLGAGRAITDQACAAGMLHDIGVLILGANLPREYDEILGVAEAEGIPSWKAELRRFGKTHMQVGGYLLGIWGIAEPIVETAAFHHTPLALGRHGGLSVLALVHVADAIADGILGGGNPRETAGLDSEFLDVLGLTSELPRLQEELRSKYDARRERAG